jgi:hypothetical protein
VEATHTRAGLEAESIVDENGGGGGGVRFEYGDGGRYGVNGRLMNGVWDTESRRGMERGYWKDKSSADVSKSWIQGC